MQNSNRRRSVALAGVAFLTVATVGFTPLSAAAETSTPTPTSAPTSDAASFSHDTMGSTIRANDPHYKGSESGTMAPRALARSAVPAGTRGIDVSHWQGAINWGKVSSNVKFAYIKATESTTYEDPRFGDNYTGAYKAGVIRGAYHFALPNKSSGAAQARFFVKNGGGWSADGKTLPPLLDIEYNPYGSTCYGLTDSQMVSWIKSFAKEMVSRTGRPPAIYTTTDWWRTCTGNSSAFTNSPLFVARYNSTVGTLPNGWPVYTFWQFSDATNPPSYPGDQDVFNGSTSQLRSLAKGKTDPKPVQSGLKKRKKNGTSGWNQFSHVVGVGDYNGDKKPDLLAIRRNGGSLHFYAGTGSISKGGGYKKHTKLSKAGWNQFSKLIPAGDFNNDGKNDFLVVKKDDGSLWFYAGKGKAGAGSTGYKPRVRIGTSGWGKFSKVLGVGDFNGDKKPDLLAVKKSNGSLWFYAGTGKASAKSEGYKPRVKIGNSGWGQFSKILGVGDFNGDKKPDLLAVKKTNGSLWFYAGTGKASAKSEGYKAHVRIGKSGWGQYSRLIAPGDFNSDSKPDLLAVKKSNGSLWFYAGTGKSGRK